jgi:hypothetical protein
MEPPIFSQSYCLRSANRTDKTFPTPTGSGITAMLLMAVIDKTSRFPGKAAGAGGSMELPVTMRASQIAMPTVLPAICAGKSGKLPSRMHPLCSVNHASVICKGADVETRRPLLSAAS